MIYPDWWGSTPPTIDTLTAWCENNQVKLCMESGNLADLWGAYHENTRTIYISRYAPTAWAVPILAHETFHAAARHDGHQSEAIEARIDEAVAQAIINPAEYRFWESQYGWSTGGIASALSLPRWVVEAYRRCLAQREPQIVIK